MKINKKKLKEIILEELNNMEEITSAAASSGGWTHIKVRFN